MTAAGFLVSFALPVTFSSAAGPRAAAAAIPAGSFLVETDSPWLAPGGAGARNEPTTAVRVAVELARLRNAAARRDRDPGRAPPTIACSAPERSPDAWHEPCIEGDPYARAQARTKEMEDEA